VVKVHFGEAWEWSGGCGDWNLRGVGICFDAFMSHLPARYREHARIGKAMPNFKFRCLFFIPEQAKFF
jgi:hypothetical protein